MSDETRRVLDLLAQGKVTVDEADQLLRAIAAAGDGARATPTPPLPSDATASPRYVRITVHRPARDDRREKDVNIRVPISVVKSGMRLGALIPGFPSAEVSARLRERGIDLDFSKLDGGTLESVLKELADKNIELDSGKAQVRISCE
jgi:SHOCT-like protein